MNEAPEQLSSPPVLYSWLRHLPTWVQQPSHGLLSLQLPLPRGMIVLQSKGPDEEDPEEEELPLSSLLDDVASGCADDVASGCADDVASGCAATCTCEPGTRPPKSSGRTSQEDFIRPVEALDGARRRIGTLEHPDVDGDAERIADQLIGFLNQSAVQSYSKGTRYLTVLATSTREARDTVGDTLCVWYTKRCFCIRYGNLLYINRRRERGRARVGHKQLSKNPV